MRIRIILLISILLPILFLFGLESYLVRHDTHTKYLSQLKETLLQNSGEASRNPSKIANLITNIDEGEFSNAAACLRAGLRDNACIVGKSNISIKNIDAVSTIDTFNGGYSDMVEENIEDFLDKFVINGVTPERDLSFDFSFEPISDKDINSWNYFNHAVTAKRSSYYAPSIVGSKSNEGAYDTAVPILGPVIDYSSTPPIIGGRVRILAVSDSFGAGDALYSREDTWARELEYQLNLLEDKYEVVILAQGGAGYNEFLDWTEGGYIQAIDPDIVIFSYFKNDFNLVRDFISNISDIKLLGLDKELVFYLRCFEEDDNLVGKSLKKLKKYFPSLYRFYKFSSCSEELSTLDSTHLIDKVEVANSYKRIDSLINVPTFLYQIESILQLETAYAETLKSIHENGLNFLVNSNSNGLLNSNDCLNAYSINFKTCREFKANAFDWHFNRFYSKSFIESNIVEIKKSIDRYVGRDFASRERKVIENKSEAVIVDFLPNTLFVSNVDNKRATVGFFKGESYGYGRSSENFCVPFDRRGVILNFNKYLTEGREVKISSEFQRDGLGLVARGYDSQGRVVFGEAIELKAGSPVTFIGSESVRGVVVVSNNKDCGSRRTDIEDEFLLQIEIL